MCDRARNEAEDIEAQLKNLVESIALDPSKVKEIEQKVKLAREAADKACELWERCTNYRTDKANLEKEYQNFLAQSPQVNANFINKIEALKQKIQHECVMAYGHHQCSGSHTQRGYLHMLILRDDPLSDLVPWRKRFPTSEMRDDDYALLWRKNAIYWC
eukprot:TRINITY_DN182_c0_g1_i2.p1 TRINITY_DN182_c0_g1~~TRINITY_DN182_c0_g1_i2.p1  ORF type:complete len:159 (+),score=25.48 TRINITY_DN182_c0_g1_i2:1-477(+)